MEKFYIRTSLFNEIIENKLETFLEQDEDLIPTLKKEIRKNFLQNDIVSLDKIISLMEDIMEHKEYLENKKEN